eukprot:2510373-Amphidinium_carterae.1
MAQKYLDPLLCSSRSTCWEVKVSHTVKMYHTSVARKVCYKCGFRYHITSVDEPLGPPSGQSEPVAILRQDKSGITKRYGLFFNEHPSALARQHCHLLPRDTRKHPTGTESNCRKDVDVQNLCLLGHGHT